MGQIRPKRKRSLTETPTAKNIKNLLKQGKKKLFPKENARPDEETWNDI